MLWAQAEEASGGTSRFAWLASIALAIALLALPAGAASAASAPLGPVPLAFEDDEETDELDGEEECAEAEEERRAGEIDASELEEACEEDEGEGGSGGQAEECVLRSFHARAAATTKPNRLKLTIGYTTYEPASATVEVRKGSTRLASVRRHLGRSGVLRIVKVLSKPAPRRISVRIRVHAVPASCSKRQTKTVAVPRPRR